MPGEFLPQVDFEELLVPDGLFVLGHARRDTLTLTPAWTELKEMKHGDSMMRFLKCSSVAPQAAT